jgi:hypothetical protein
MEGQWEFWDYDPSSFGSVHRVVCADGDDHHDDREESQECGPISNLSFLDEEEDSRHLFAASMFQRPDDKSGSQDSNDDSSVHSQRTVVMSNRTQGRQAQEENATDKLPSLPSIAPSRDVKSSPVKPELVKQTSSPYEFVKNCHCRRTKSWCGVEACVADHSLLGTIERHGPASWAA